MRNKIIVGVDGTSQSIDALALAASVAADTGASVTAAYIYRKEPPAETQDREYRRQLRERSAEILKLAKEQLPDGIEAEGFAFPAKTTAQGLRDLAVDVEADLIVLGSPHHGALGRVLIGSVGELLCSEAPCAVAVAPSGLSEAGVSPKRRIGVAFDGSEESRAALIDALHLAESRGSDLVALTVLEPSHLPLRHNTDKAQAEVEAKLAEALAGLDSSVTVEHRFRQGNPAEELSEAAKEVDLLVVGSRSLGPVGGALLGSVSAKLMRSAPSPIMVVASQRAPGKQHPQSTAQHRSAERDDDMTTALRVEEVHVSPLSIAAVGELLDPEDWQTFQQAMSSAEELLAGRVLWNVNSTAQGGGVAEMLRSWVAYARGVGMDMRWMTMGGHADFFELTKRIHNMMHGEPGNDGVLDEADRALYEQVTSENASDLLAYVKPDDVVLLARSADRRHHPPSVRERRHDRLALPHRRRRGQSECSRGLGLPAALRGAGRCLRVLAAGIRAHMDL